MSSDQNEEVTVLHSQWLQHPCTNAFLKGLKSHRETVITHLSVHALDNDITESTVRSSANSIKVLDSVIKGITDISRFTNITKQ